MRFSPGENTTGPFAGFCSDMRALATTGVGSVGSGDMLDALTGAKSRDLLGNFLMLSCTFHYYNINIAIYDANASGNYVSAD